MGQEGSVYRASLEFPTGMSIIVEPSSLTFTQKNQKQGIVLSVEIDSEAPRMTHGSLIWVDQHNHTVSSRIMAIEI